MPTHLLMPRASSYELQPNAIAIRPVAGSIWGTAAFRSKAYNECVSASTLSRASHVSSFCSSAPPVENVGLFPSSVTRLAVTVCIPNEADISHGDQAGILLYSSDSQWVKLVVEGDKAAGSRMLILAKMPSNADAVSEGAEPEASVSKKWTLGCDALKPVRLQLELRRGATGCSVIASCDHDEAVVALPVPFECARFGIMAHLCREKAPFPRGHWFHFSDFALQTNTSS